MLSQKTYNIMEKIPHHFAPTSTLSSLEKTLCLKLNSGLKNQHSCYPNKEDLTTGSIGITLPKSPPNYFEKKIKNIIKAFYVNEGYDINDDEKEIFSVRKQGEENYIFIFKSENSYLISVCKNPEE